MFNLHYFNLSFPQWGGSPSLTIQLGLERQYVPVYVKATIREEIGFSSSTVICITTKWQLDPERSSLNLSGEHLVPAFVQSSPWLLSGSKSPVIKTWANQAYSDRASGSTFWPTTRIKRPCTERKSAWTLYKHNQRCFGCHLIALWGRFCFVIAAFKCVAPLRDTLIFFSHCCPPNTLPATHTRTHKDMRWALLP